MHANNLVHLIIHSLASGGSGYSSQSYTQRFPIQLKLPPLSTLLSSRIRNPQHEINHHRKQQNNRQHRRAKAIVEAGLAAEANALRAPVIGEEGVEHCGHSDDSEQEGADEGGAVAEVQHADGERAENDGEVEP